MIAMGKYMRARPEVNPGRGVTKIWSILARDDFVLGTVKWKSSWRCYVFEPEAYTAFNDTCLCEMRTFLSAETAKRLHPNFKEC